MTLISAATSRSCREPADDEPLDLAAAVQLIRSGALRDAPVGPVGLELEGHLHHRHDPQAPLSYEIVDGLARSLTPLPFGGRVSVEPGGQLEVSSACHPDVAAAITATRAEVDLVRDRLAALGLDWTFRGADPWRGPRRIHPGDRYQGMEEWFDGEPDGGLAGRAMMCSTAALQLNLEAGRRDQWADRVRRAVALEPVITALSATSRWSAGVDTGLCSSRQRIWASLDPRLAGRFDGGQDPVDSWVDRVLAAPVLHLSGPRGLSAARPRRSLADWLSDSAGWPPPTPADLRRHLTTQFPSVRLRGFLELRSPDALPEPWWPALVAALVVWMDDPAAHPVVDAALAPVADRNEAAYVHGVADPLLRAAAERCLAVALELSPVEQPVLAELLALVRSGRAPGDLLGDPRTEAL